MLWHSVPRTDVTAAIGKILDRIGCEPGPDFGFDKNPNDVKLWVKPPSEWPEFEQSWFPALPENQENK